MVVSEDTLSCGVSDDSEGVRSGVEAVVVLGEGVWGLLRTGVGGTTISDGDCIKEKECSREGDGWNGEERAGSREERANGKKRGWIEKGSGRDGI